MSFKIDRRFVVLAAIAAGALAHAVPLRAAEDEDTTKSASALGVAAGLLPPPGVYGTLQATHSGASIKDGSGTGLPVKLRSNALEAGVLWVPSIRLFGADYGIGLSEPLHELTIDTPHSRNEAAGLSNTMLNLSTFSWDLGHGLHASIGANVFINDASYTLGKAANIGRNFTSYDPHGALTYLVGDWALTSSLQVEFNTENSASHYTSGDTLLLDLTALRRFGSWEIGLGSEILRQISDDKRYGEVVPAVINGHDRGNRSRNVSLGPVVGYDFGKVAVQAYYQQSVSAANVAGGYEVGLRANFPLYTDGPLSPGVLDAAGKR